MVILRGDFMIETSAYKNGYAEGYKNGLNSKIKRWI